MPTHDLEDFMNSVTRQIAEEYQRIQKRATEDPGTAGDQGEENWASILRAWLPSTMHIVTKGRILSDKGVASPQVDVIILRPEYPSALLDKKLYLAGGVLAAFECKTTLKSHHIKKFVSNSIEIKSHLPNITGTPYKELQSPILYGLLSHSHSWTEDSSKSINLITEKLLKADQEFVDHPKLMPDLVCVADLACWSATKMVFLGPQSSSFWNDSLTEQFGIEGSATSFYNCHSKETVQKADMFTAIGALIYNLATKLSMNDQGLKALALYYQQALQTGSEGAGRKWPITIYSEGIRKSIVRGDKQSGDTYNEWSWFRP